MTREEAIKCVKEWKESLIFENIKEALDTLIPELAESGDEKIRKWLIEMVEEFRKVNPTNAEYNGSCSEAIAYLEKQSNALRVEKAMREIDEKAKAFTEAHKGESADEILAQMRGEEQSDDDRIRRCIGMILTDATEQRFTDFGVSLKDCLNWLDKQKHLYETTKDRFYREGFEEGQLYEKQKEKKPILEVSGFRVGDVVRLKDGDGRKHIIKSFEEVEGLHGPNFYHVEFEDNSARTGIYLGEDYPNGFYTQMEKIEEERNSAEWDEVELEFRGEKVKVKRPFFRDDKGRRYSTTEQDEDVAWYALRAWCEKKGVSLYDLYPREEWSEADEIKIHFLKALIQNQVRDCDYLFGHNGKDCVSKQEAIEMLSSLRPSWKPTEEQLKALQMVRDSHCFMYQQERMAIETLLNQLKSL